jgi:hypothetical protein
MAGQGFGSSKNTKGLAVRNAPAQISAWAGLAGVLVVALFLTDRSLPILRLMGPIFFLPVFGSVATVSGIVGLTRNRTVAGGTAQSVIGLILGLSLLSLFGAALLLVWAIGHSNFDF